MEVILSPGQLSGTVVAPASKSYMHRALICSSMSDRPTEIICNTFSKDIEATINCLAALGAKFETEGNLITVTPIDDVNKGCVLDCKESGSTLRFMLPFAAALGVDCTFVGAERLGKRPLGPLLKALNEHGVETVYSSDSFLPLKIKGRLSGGDFIVPGDISSQFVTGLMLALGIAGSGTITTIGPLKSAPYVDITASVQSDFGVEIEKSDNGYAVSSNGYISPGRLTIEGDYSNGAFWLVAGAIGSPEGIKIDGLKENSIQGDSRIVDILLSMGADLKREGDSIIVKKSALRGIEIDCDDIPDIVPILSVAASCAEGRTTFRNIERLRAKESDRVESTVNMIKDLGGKITFDENNIYIEGTSLKGGVVDSVNDHRIAMSGAIASTVADGEVKIITAQAVGKSYPDFYDNLKMLGADWRLV